MRQPYQILVFPFVKEEENYYYALFQRRDLKVWQGLAGGGEEGETLLTAAKREAYEEALIDKSSKYFRLSSLATIPAENIGGFKWGQNIIMIPEFCFGVEVDSKEMVKTGNEHLKHEWFPFKEAMKKLKWDSNKSALWELNYRLKNENLVGSTENIEVVKNILGT